MPPSSKMGQGTKLIYDVLSCGIKRTYLIVKELLKSGCYQNEIHHGYSSR